MAEEEPLRHVEIVHDDECREALVRNTRIVARELTSDDVGKFIGCFDDGLSVNYQARILAIQRIETGRAPGVSLVCRHPILGDRPARTESMHIPFDSDLELIELIAL